MPHLLRAFVSRHPNVELRLIAEDGETLFEDLCSGKVNALAPT